MQFGLQFYLQLPRPWGPDAERQLLEDAITQVELADRLGYSHAWFAEQHFLEEYSHSSAPEILLAALARTTNRIRLGHGIALTPPPYNSPIRLAERTATLDLLSDGRVDLGFGNSKSRIELEGFGVAADQRQAMTLEAVTEIAAMLSQTPYPGHAGVHFSMPTRNIVPKPQQRPHPPLWMACSNEQSVLLAARLGVGALAHTFADPDETRRVVTAYYETFRSECVPISDTVNPNVAMLIPFHCAKESDVAMAEGLAAHGFFTYALRHYYSFGRHRPGLTDLAADYDKVRQRMGGQPVVSGNYAFGTPAELGAYFEEYAAAGLDQAILLHHAGRLSPADTLTSLELFGHSQLLRFAEQHAQAHQRKAAELAPHIAAALRRRAEATPAELIDTVVEAYGRSRPSPSAAGRPDEQKPQLARLDQLKHVAMELDG